MWLGITTNASNFALGNGSAKPFPFGKNHAPCVIQPHSAIPHITEQTQSSLRANRYKIRTQPGIVVSLQPNAAAMALLVHCGVPQISSNNPSASFSTASGSARISSKVRMALVCRSND